MSSASVPASSPFRSRCSDISAAGHTQKPNLTLEDLWDNADENAEPPQYVLAGKDFNLGDEVLVSNDDT